MSLRLNKKGAEDAIDRLAMLFHEYYEQLAPEHGYATKEESRKPWDEVPTNNKALMRRVVADVLFYADENDIEGVIEYFKGSRPQ